MGQEANTKGIEKKCKQCSESKPLTEFHKHPNCKDGHKNKCKECTSEYKRRLYQEYKSNPVVWSAMQRQARQYYRAKVSRARRAINN